MAFKYKTLEYGEFEETAIKTLLRTVYDQTGEIVQLDNVDYVYTETTKKGNQKEKTIRWDDPKSRFVQKLDMPIEQFRTGVELDAALIEEKEESILLVALELANNKKNAQKMFKLLEKIMSMDSTARLKEIEKVKAKGATHKANVARKKLEQYHKQALKKLR